MDAYHSTVGLNANLIVDIAVPPSGAVAYNHVERYKQFGNYLEQCYGGKPVLSIQETKQKIFYLNFNKPVFYLIFI